MEGSRPLKKAAQYTTHRLHTGPAELRGSYSLNSMVSLRFTGTPLMCTYWGMPSLYGG